MKILKKLSALFICFALLFSSACSTGETVVSNMFASQYWLSNTETDVGEINETSVYTVSFVEAEADDGKTQLKSTLSGTLTTNIQTATYENQKCYKFTTNLTASGTYTYGDQTVEINDSITSTVYFLGISAKFFPLYSEKSVNVTSPIKNSSVEFIPVAYSVTTKYDKSANSATVKVVSNLPEDAKYKIADSERVYEKITKGAPYLDNESLIFIPRASDLKEGFSASFRTIDALSQKVHNMNLAVSSTSATVEIKLDSYTVDGVPVNPTFNCYSANISISGTFSGTAIKAYYSADAKTHGKRLVKMENELAYSLGKIVYTLQSVTNA
jgi:hypothetical protein